MIYFLRGDFMFAITNAGKRELPVLFALMRQAGMETDEAALTKAILEEKTSRAMIMDMDGPAGFCLWDDVPGFRANSMFIRMVYLIPALRGQKLGSLLFENLARIAEMEAMEFIRWDASLGTKWAGDKGTVENGRVCIDAEKIPELWGHCHCH